MHMSNNINIIMLTNQIEIFFVFVFVLKSDMTKIELYRAEHHLTEGGS